MKIAFYFPYPDIGGVPILFLRLANILSASNKIFIIDQNDGYMKRNMPEGCVFIPYDKPEDIPSDCILVMQSCPFWRIPFIERFDPKIKVFFWNLHPNNLNTNLFNTKYSLQLLKLFIDFFSFYRKRKIRALVNLLINGKSIRFMDLENLVKTEFYISQSIDLRDFLPITNGINTQEVKSYSAPIVSEVIKCIVISRMDEYKIQMLYYIIKQISTLVEFSFYFTIVGKGSGVSKLIDLLDKSSNIMWEYHENIHHEEIHAKLATNHISFAMGTSALDSSSLAIPTVMLDYSEKEIDEYRKFRFIYENVGLTLAQHADNDNIDLKNRTIKELILYICSNGSEVSKRCLDYYSENHSPKKMEFLPYLLEKSEVTIADVKFQNLHKADIITDIAVKVFSRYKIDSSGFIKF